MSKLEEYRKIFRKIKKYLDYVFYIMFSLKYILQFLTTTIVWVSVYGKMYSVPYAIADGIFIVYTVIYLMIILLFEETDLSNKIVAMTIIVIAFLYVALSETSINSIYEYLMIMALALNKSYKKILKITIVEGTTIMLLFLLLSQAGIVKDHIMSRGRHALGMVYCTDCGAHLLFLLLSYIVYVDYKLTREVEAILIFGVLIEYAIINSKTATICIVVLILGLLMNKYKKKIIIAARNVMLLIFPIAFGGFMFLKYLNDRWSDIFPDNTFTDRLYLTTIGIQKYGIALWGRTIHQNGNGGGGIGGVELLDTNNIHEHILLVVYTLVILIFIISTLVMIKRNNKFFTSITFVISSVLLLMPKIITKLNNDDKLSELNTINHYFFLDNSFVSVLLCQGGIVFILIMILGVFIQYRAYKSRKYEFMFIMCIVVLECTMEHHMMDISYNVLFLLGLTDMLNGGINNKEENGNRNDDAA